MRAGVTHNFARYPRDPAPGETITLELTAGPAQKSDRAWVYWSTDSVDPSGEHGRAQRGFARQMQTIGVEWDTLVWGYIRKFRVVLDGFEAGTVVRYRMSAETAQGEESFADEGAYYGFYVDNDPLPEWTRDAIVYQIFVDRFNPGPGNMWKKPASLSGFYGGTLIGITDKLDYIRSLGADTLWLTPIFPSPSHHGYDATDVFEIEPRYGKKDDLRKLLDAAHLRKMRVLLDLVPNHWSDRHATFQDALKNPNSVYHDWYRWIKYPDRYESFFGVRSHPQINLRNSEARAHMLEAAAYWLEFGVDGFRLDYAIGPAPDFWADFRKVTRSVKPDCWTFGEVVDPSDRQLSFEGQLDGCLDFVLLEAMRQTFAFGCWDAQRFASFIDQHETYFPGSFSRPSFLDNHDMNRFLWACDGDKRRLRLAALCQYTLMGPPVVYYGTEVSLSQERDIRQGTRGIPEEARQPMLWGERQDQDMLAYYRGLGEVRREQAALRGGKRKLVMAKDGILAYTRGTEDSSLLVVLNLSSMPQVVSIQGHWNFVLFGTTLDVNGQQNEGLCQVELPPFGGAVVV